MQAFLKYLLSGARAALIFWTWSKGLWTIEEGRELKRFRKSRKAPGPKKPTTMMDQLRDRLLGRPWIQRVIEGTRQLTLLMGRQLWIPPWLAKTFVGTVEYREKKAIFAPVRAAERWDNNKIFFANST